MSIKMMNGERKTIIDNKEKRPKINDDISAANAVDEIFGVENSKHRKVKTEMSSYLIDVFSEGATMARSSNALFEAMLGEDVDPDDYIVTESFTDTVKKIWNKIKEFVKKTIEAIKKKARALIDWVRGKKKDKDKKKDEKKDEKKAPTSSSSPPSTPPTSSGSSEPASDNKPTPASSNSPASSSNSNTAPTPEPPKPAEPPEPKSFKIKCRAKNYTVATDKTKFKDPGEIQDAIAQCEMIVQEVINNAKDVAKLKKHAKQDIDSLIDKYENPRLDTTDDEVFEYTYPDEISEGSGFIEKIINQNARPMIDRIEKSIQRVDKDIQGFKDQGLTGNNHIIKGLRLIGSLYRVTLDAANKSLNTAQKVLAWLNKSHTPDEGEVVIEGYSESGWGQVYAEVAFMNSDYSSRANAMFESLLGPEPRRGVRSANALFESMLEGETSRYKAMVDSFFGINEADIASDAVGTIDVSKNGVIDLGDSEVGDITKEIVARCFGDKPDDDISDNTIDWNIPGIARESGIYPYSNQLTGILEDSIYYGELTPVLEFFKFQGHQFKNKKELESYIKQVSQEDEADRKLARLLVVLIAAIPVTMFGVGAITLNIPLMVASTLGSIFSIIFDYIVLYKAHNKAVKQAKEYDEISRAIAKKKGSLAQAMNKTKDPKERKRLGDTIRELDKLESKCNKERKNFQRKSKGNVSAEFDN